MALLVAALQRQEYQRSERVETWSKFSRMRIYHFHRWPLNSLTVYFGKTDLLWIHCRPLYHALYPALYHAQYNSSTMNIPLRISSQPPPSERLDGRLPIQSQPSRVLGLSS